MKRFLIAVFVVACLGLGLLLAAGKGWLGEHEGPGIITDQRVPVAAVEERVARQREAIERAGAPEDKQILFGDLHVHTTLSFDAFLSSLPLMNGEGAQPLADACDFARYCSALDFWSINDHAEASTPRRWQETVESIRQCNAVAGTGPAPDTVAFLGWEWTQVGSTPDTHYGHKNVILRDLEDDRIPPRPINSGGVARQALGGISVTARAYLIALDPSKRMLDFARYVEELRSAENCPEDVPTTELPADCRESAGTPAELFRRLRAQGHEAMVIPHGTTWGFYTPAGSTWDKQLAGDMHDPELQSLIEVFSGHGNSEEYRPWRATELDEQGRPVCPAPVEGYLPSCWRAGQIIESRCLEAGEDTALCEQRAAMARQDYVNTGTAGHLAVGGESAADWLDAGQCTDCYLPAFNYRPGGAVQYIMALTNFDEPDAPRRFRFGFMASSDNHRARPGTGYKEFFRRGMADPTGGRDEKIRELFGPPLGEPLPYSEAIDFGGAFDVPDNLIASGSPVKAVDLQPFRLAESERQASYFMTGGLVAAHATGRDRESIWQALERREVYGTSGDRILLWFDLVNAAPDALPMGSEAEMTRAPSFRVRAVGAFKQKPGCPDYATTAVSPEELESMCRGECYNPSDERKLITRIEVVRILPQQEAGEDVAPLVEDPWRVYECRPNPAGCAARFTDEEYPRLGRDAVYYVRAIESPSPAVNAGGVRCEYDGDGRCVKVNLCYADDRTPADDDCLAMNEERAWSSPIFVDWGGSAR